MCLLFNGVGTDGSGNVQKINRLKPVEQTG